MKRLAAALFLAVAIFGASAPSLMSRSNLRTIENRLNRALAQTIADDPFELLSAVQSVHIPGFGVVFTTELDLLASARPNPFGRPIPTGKDLEALRDKKRVRIGFLKERMQQILMQTAGELETVGPDETIVIAVSIPHYSFMGANNLPQQVVMYAKKRDLQATAAGGSTEGLHTEERY